MRRFDLVEPKSLEEACAYLADDGDAKAIAGGTALLTLIKQGLYFPKTLVNLCKIRGASEITYNPHSGLRIGALASIADIEHSAIVRVYYPVLAEACRVVANIRIRNMATIGGNLAHGDYQSDPPTVLTALDAGVELLSERGKRRLKLAEFLLGPYETAVEAGELISTLVIPPTPPGLRGVYLKFTTGSSEERPCAGAVALARLENGVCRELRLAVGAVSPRPLRVDTGETMARNERLTSPLIERIAAEAARNVDPIDDIHGPADYKRHLVEVLARRAIAAAANGKSESLS